MYNALIGLNQLKQNGNLLAPSKRGLSAKLTGGGKGLLT